MCCALRCALYGLVCCILDHGAAQLAQLQAAVLHDGVDVCFAKWVVMRAGVEQLKQLANSAIPPHAMTPSMLISPGYAA